MYRISPCLSVCLFVCQMQVWVYGGTSNIIVQKVKDNKRNVC